MKIAQAILLFSATALSALAVSESAATAGPIVPRGHYCLSCNLAVLIAALRATNSVWKLHWLMMRSATARPLAMTKMIEPVSSVGNGLEVTGQALFLCLHDGKQGETRERLSKANRQKRRQSQGDDGEENRQEPVAHVRPHAAFYTQEDVARSCRAPNAKPAQAAHEHHNHYSRDKRVAPHGRRTEDKTHATGEGT